MKLQCLDFAQAAVVHADEMEVALIVGDQESRKVAGRLPKDLDHRIRGVVRERGMWLAVALNNIGDREMPHAIGLAIMVNEYNMASLRIKGASHSSIV
jgi:hypothetical protein